MSLGNVFWGLVRTSFGLDLDFWRFSGWNLWSRIEFLFNKYRLIFLIGLRITRFQFGQSHVQLRGGAIYYDTPFGLAGYQALMARNGKMLKELGITKLRNLVDVGANVGFFSLMFLDHFPEATIYGLEPVPAIFDCLSKNFSSRRRCFVFNRAVSDLVGELTMSFNENLSSLSRVINRPGEIPSPSSGRIVKVPATTLDVFSLENHLEFIDFLKIDTESFEARVLRGARSILTRTKYLHLEVSIYQNPNYTFSELNSLLFSPNYNFQLLYFRNFDDKGSGPLPVGEFLYKNVKLMESSTKRWNRSL